MLFLGNLLLGENNELKNKYLRIETDNDNVEEDDIPFMAYTSGQNYKISGQKKWSDCLIYLKINPI